MDLSETVRLIQDTAVKASGAEKKLELVKPPAEPEYVYLAVNPSGGFQRIEAVAKPRAHSLVTLEQVLRFVELKGDEKKTVVWYDRDGIIVVVDDGSRRDKATMKLNYTPQMLTLMMLEQKRPEFEQRGFRRLLKVDLAGCRRNDILVSWVESVRFNSTAMSAGRIQHQKESLGRDIDEEAISDQGECPEELLLDVRVFDDPNLRDTFQIRCDVEVLVSDQKFRLTPLPLEIHNAIEAQVSQIGDALTSHVKCPVFRGKP